MKRSTRTLKFIAPALAALCLISWAVVDRPASAQSTTTLSYQPINFSAFHNFRYQNLEAAYPEGSVTLGGVPFQISAGGNNSWVASEPENPGLTNPKTLTVNVGVAGATEVHTLINTIWGRGGTPSLAGIEFFGSGGGYFKKELIGNEDIRDYLQGAFTNSINNTTTTEVFNVSGRRLDKQRISLPAEFAGQTLDRIVVTDTGAQNVQRLLVAGITVASPSATPTQGPPNDNFQNATLIGFNGDDCLDGTNVGATVQTNEANHGGRGGSAFKSVWYKWSAPRRAQAEFRLGVSGASDANKFDTQLGVYKLLDGGNILPIANKDRFEFPTTRSEKATFEAEAGKTYYIAVDGAGGASGKIKLCWATSERVQAAPVTHRITKIIAPPTGLAVTRAKDANASGVLEFTIQGENFSAGSVLYIDGLFADAQVTVINPTELRVQLPVSYLVGAENLLLQVKIGNIISAPAVLQVANYALLVIAPGQSQKVCSPPVNPLKPDLVFCGAISCPGPEACKITTAQYNKTLLPLIAASRQQLKTDLATYSTQQQIGSSEPAGGSVFSTGLIGPAPPSLAASLEKPGSFSSDAKLIGLDGSTLVGHDGSSLIGQDGSTLIGQDGSTLIGLDGSTLIGQDGASLIGQDGGSLVGHDGSSAPAMDDGFGASQSTQTPGRVRPLSFDGRRYTGWFVVSGSNGAAPSITNSADQTGKIEVTFDNTSSPRVSELNGSLFAVVDSPTVVEFSAATYSVNEGAGSATVTLTRSGNLDRAASVDYSTAADAEAAPCGSFNGRASERCDFSVTFGTARFAAGETAKTFTVPVVDDSYGEGAETFTLRLIGSADSALGVRRTATLTVQDNEATTATVNSIDDTSRFVRQQYLDFLNREPDAAGHAFWTKGIESCTTQQCVEVRRVDTSAAFFLSIEFQETGFFVYLLNQAAYGTGPRLRLRDFLVDTQQVGAGVVVLADGWEAKLEANKQAFVRVFVSRPEFGAKYPRASSAEGFLDALNANTGNSLSAAERDKLVGSLKAGTVDRAGVLRAVAENAAFRRREFTRAFVLMQYFGYLRRNPDEAPDSDLAGYNFWLSKLDEFGGDYRRAEMVRAFIQSIEYRRRFGH